MRQTVAPHRGAWGIGFPQYRQQLGGDNDRREKRGKPRSSFVTKMFMEYLPALVALISSVDTEAASAASFFSQSELTFSTLNEKKIGRVRRCDAFSSN